MFSGFQFVSENIPDFLQKRETQQIVHSVYNTSYMSARVPNRLSSSIYSACQRYLSKDDYSCHRDSLSIVSIPENDGYFCVICKKSTEYMFSAGHVDNNGIITSLSSSKTVTVLEAEGLMLALLPFALKDDEAMTCMDSIEKIETMSEAEKATHSIELSHEYILLTDNLYRRHMLTEGTAALPIKSRIGKLRNEDLDICMYSAIPLHPFRFVSTNEINKDYEGMYAFQERKWTEDEKRLIPHLRKDYVMPDYVLQICKRMKATTIYPSPMRTALLSGPAGSGKSEGSRAIFACLGLPYLFQTCGEGTEFLDLIGQIMPTGKSNPVSFDEVRKQMGLPSTEEILNDPDAAYTLLYKKAPDVIYDESDLIHEVCQRTMDEVRKISAQGKDFVYIESPFIKAVKNGYGFELQEVDMLKRPSIIVGLNALLESGHNSVITLPTGEVIKKHPDCTIILTDNAKYEGARKLNQAVLSRMSMVYLLPDPSASEMMERAKGRLNFDNEKLLYRMTKTVKDIQSYCQREDISDGVCGQRELENWCMSVLVEADAAGYTINDVPDEIVHDCAIETIINKTSQEQDEIARIRTACLDKEFVG